MRLFPAGIGINFGGFSGSTDVTHPVAGRLHANLIGNGRLDVGISLFGAGQMQGRLEFFHRSCSSLSTAAASDPVTSIKGIAGYN